MLTEQMYLSDSPCPAPSSSHFPEGYFSLWFVRFPCKWQAIRDISIPISWLIASCCIVFLLSGCGPETQSAVDSEQLFADTERIAQEYVSNNDLGYARAALSNISVANANQWLVYVTETNIRNSPDATITNSLIQLSLDLGLNSALIEQHGIQIGLIQPTPVIDSDDAAQTESVQNVAQSEILNTNGESNRNPEGVSAETTISRALELEEPEDDETGNEDTPLTADSSAPTQRKRVGDLLASSNGRALTDSADGDSTDVDEKSNVGNVSSSSDGSTSETTTSNGPANIVVEAEPTATESPSIPLVTANGGLNVRGGPSTEYPIIAGLTAGQSALVIGQNAQGDWWQIQLDSGQEGWVFGQLVSTTGNASGVGVAVNIPTPPPTSTPLPPPTPTEVPPEQEEPSVPEEQPAPPTSGNDFVLIEKRLWGAEENGGRWNGPSLICGEKRQLHVYVLDTGGAPVNGVAIQEQYGAKQILVTGSQGKGDGKVEIVLGGGQDVKVLRDNQGNSVTSDLASGLVTVPGDIPFEYLIAAGYCSDDASCNETIVKPYACGGHWSWTVKFQMNPQD
ncbi:MAG: SH3 domain-containing protein [Chloroflexota bacterium]